MRILFLAPQPFYQERGTPIAVRLATEVISRRREDSICLMTYDEGHNVDIPNVSQKRVRGYPRIIGIQPGFSFKKVYLDIFFFGAALREIWRCRKKQYHLIHAVEESVFIALLAKFIFRIPYIYDMDSSLALQLTEKLPQLRFFTPLFQWLERLAIRHSLAVVPVCDALEALAAEGGASRTQILRDISLLDYNQDETAGETAGAPNLREEAGIQEDAEVVLYIGNLERYQGIDLLVESFARIWKEHPKAHLLIIGGADEHRTLYQTKCQALGIPKERAQFLGPRPVSKLSVYLKQADILTSPRTLGNNTPMKIYSYIHSGVVLLATDLPTHTQVLSPEIAKLAAPTPEAFSKAMSELLSSKEERETLSNSARILAEELYTFEVFEKRLNELYDSVGSEIEHR